MAKSRNLIRGVGIATSTGICSISRLGACRRSHGSLVAVSCRRNLVTDIAVTALAGVGGKATLGACRIGYDRLVGMLVGNRRLLSTANAIAVGIDVLRIVDLSFIVSADRSVPVMSLILAPSRLKGMVMILRAIGSLALAVSFAITLAVADLATALGFIFVLDYAEIAEHALNHVARREAERDHSAKQKH